MNSVRIIHYSQFYNIDRIRMYGSFVLWPNIFASKPLELQDTNLSINSLSGQISRLENHKSIDIYTFSKNVQNAICAGGFETRKSAFFNFIVTTYSTLRKICDCNFFDCPSPPRPPSQKRTFFWTFILLVIFILFW